MNWLDLLAVQETLKSLLQHHSSKTSILWCSAFFTVQLSHPYIYTYIHTYIYIYTHTHSVFVCLFAQLCPTLCNLMDYSRSGSSVHRILQARILEWSGLPFPSPGDLPDPEIEPRSPVLQADSLPFKPPGKPIHIHPHTQYVCA